MIGGETSAFRYFIAVATTLVETLNDSRYAFRTLSFREAGVEADNYNEIIQIRKHERIAGGVRDQRGNGSGVSRVGSKALFSREALGTRAC